MERLTPQRRRERTRLALLDAGVLAFSRQGYHGASLDDVAEAAGYSKGAIYDHFGSKDEFFVAVLEHRGQRWMDRFAPLVDQNAASLSNILEQVTDLLLELRSDPDAAMLDAEALLHAQRHPDARQQIAAVQRATLERIAEFVRRGMESAGMRMDLDAERVAVLLSAISTGLTQLALTDPEAGHDELFEVVFAMVADLAQPAT